MTIAGALALLAFIAMVTASLLGASWVPKLSLRVPGEAPGRVAAGPLLVAPGTSDTAAATRVSAVPVTTGATVAPAGPAARPAVQTPLVTSPPTTTAARLSPSTSAPGHSSTTATTSPATRGLSHKKASAGTTTTTSVP